MKIAFFSNFLNHHQLPLCRAFLNYGGMEFVFVATEPIPSERLLMGYEDMNAYSFVLRAYETLETENQANLIAETYDLVVFGATPKQYIKRRMDKNLLSFRFCERSLKKGAWRRFIPRTRNRIYEEYIQYKDKNLYILGASAYTAHDLVLCGFDVNKCFKWGYFPEVKTRDVDFLFKEKDKNSKIEILYAGRLLKLKRVIDSLKAIRILIKKGINNFHFTIIGDGEEKKNLQAYVLKFNLQEYVSFLPFMSPEEVRSYMDKADIYIFGSNFYEGWGAVINEAMNSACAILVSHAVGSAPYLIRQGENGFVYKCGNVKDLVSKLKILIENKNLRSSMGKKAYETLMSEWNATNAVNKLLALYQRLSNNQNEIEYEKFGPCSLAQIIKNNWVKSL